MNRWANMRLLDWALRLTQWADAFHAWAFTRVYPPRATDDDQVVLSVLKDNVPSAETLARLTDE